MPPYEPEPLTREGTIVSMICQIGFHDSCETAFTLSNLRLSCSCSCHTAGADS